VYGANCLSTAAATHADGELRSGSVRSATASHAQVGDVILFAATATGLSGGAALLSGVVVVMAAQGLPDQPLNGRK
jgi:hypothetical protein